MKTFLRFVILAAIAAPMLTACANPSRATEAEDLRNSLAGLPGVANATLRYTEPIVLDSGKLELRVDMSADAASADAIDVVAAAYEGFADAHSGEEGDLFIEMGDDTIHVRSFEPDAKVEAVEQAATRAVSVFSSGAVMADINTQDVKKSPHVFTSYAVTIADRGADDVLEKMTDLEQDHGDIPNAGWGVQTGATSGWELRSTRGFPDAKHRALFNRLRSDLPKGTSIFLTDEFVNVQVRPAATLDEVTAMVGRHLETLGGIKNAFYDVTVGEDFYAMITRGDCTFAPGEFGSRLKLDHGDGCTKINKVEP